MASNSVAFFYWPQIWIGEMPFNDWEVLHVPKNGESFPIEESIDPNRLGEEVYRQTLQGKIEVKVLREGSFHFDFSQWEPGRISNDEIGFYEKQKIILTRVYLINTFLVCLYSKNRESKGPLIDKMLITPKLLRSSFTIDDNRSTGILDPFVGHLFALKKHRTYFHLTDWRFLKNVVEVLTIRKAFEFLDNIISNISSEHFQIFDLLNRSYKAYEDMDFNNCLIDSWIIIEYIINYIWKKYIDSNRNRSVMEKNYVFINSDRKDKLTSNDFTASIISEVLSLTNIIPLSLYKSFDKVRKSRNKWMHDMSPVNEESAYIAIKTAETLINQVFKLDIDAHIHYRFGS